MFCCRVGKNINHWGWYQSHSENINKITSHLTTNHKKKLHNATSNNNLKMGRKLAAFDFDHTIVDDNTDIVVRNLMPKDSIPVSLKKLYKDDGWTAYMQGVFELLHVSGHNEQAIIESVNTIVATKGMPELIKDLSEKYDYDVIIISDSNSYLINCWLESHGLKNYILKVFTNPAKFVKGVLRIQMYHLQTECKLSTKNLCKGKILEDFIDSRRSDGIEYDQVLYVGDGGNDFCPILRLKLNDLACVRDKYVCLEMVNATKIGKPIPSTGLTYEIKADVFVWNSGFEILEKIKNLFVMKMMD